MNFQKTQQQQVVPAAAGGASREIGSPSRAHLEGWFGHNRVVGYMAIPNVLACYTWPIRYNVHYIYS